MSRGTRRARVRVGVAAVAAAAALTAAAPSTGGAAANGTLSCRASAARVTAIGDSPLVSVEPIRANAPKTPCATQSAETVKQTTIGPIQVDAANAFTTVHEAPDAPAGAALAGVSSPVIGLPGLTIKVAAVKSEASYTCVSGKPVAASDSKVVDLTINGTTIKVPSGPFKLDLGKLGYVALNEKITTATSITRRALDVHTPVADVVLAESVAAYADDPCTNSDEPVVPVKACPPGSTYDPSRAVCLIREHTAGGGTKTIIIGRPFQGPSGGHVIPLDTAKHRYRHSPCVRGSGNRYVIVGTNHNDRITGTNGRDRIILLSGNDRAEGGRGNDCIDGGKGRDVLSGALGRDRLYGGPGRDALIGGSNADRLSGGSGRDTINAGFGRDRVFAGSGNDRVNVATAGPPATVSCGAGHDKLRRNRVDRERSCEQDYVIR